VQGGFTRQYGVLKVRFGFDNNGDSNRQERKETLKDRFALFASLR
jgi:hypothetical protein